MERGMAVDTLAGARGPSCSTLAQIPNLKIIHVRFIHRDNDVRDSDYESGGAETLSSKNHFSHISGTISRMHEDRHSACNYAASLSLPKVNKQAPIFPKSLSISTMLELGKVSSNSNEVTVIDIFKFDIDSMTWSVLPTKAEFVVSKEHFGEEGFRRAYKPTSNTGEFKGQEWVGKKYLPQTLACLKDTGQSPEDHPKKIIQTHMLASNFAKQLQSCVATQCPDEFGSTFSYNKVYMGKIENSSEYVTIEEYIEGTFYKYINNDSTICAIADDMELSLKAECLVHFSFYKSDGKLMSLDIQGAATKLCDPEIASSMLLSEDKQYMYCAGNISLKGINKFITSHKCNKYCKTLNLPTL